ncbi:variant surface glycoprotein (VSG), putative [Trypanosoma brucei brucei TREU927]|uniref:Variant surface glycoprotein (VSG), putative n=1 Tax=Trypanosoma brucei brucei (strain 927/4 GUTat10.1) TaxID=185431 RepID=Q4FKI0_TRYB2|nr:variant surface glycoprotein [Trypanosoma brucei brucei TREU927]EAN78985.1 variant surface glycoprotein (VSG), putative [Trypanosoma brucei brucei TREU927]CAJ16998.1 variant surface glycoprotein (VSG), putative [Trypanosoma brucei brucei TREU927]
MTPTPKATAELQRILILYIGVLFFGLNLVEAATDANAAQHRVMCLLTALANTPIKQAEITGSGGSARETISALNVTTSSSEWQKIFDTSLSREAGTNFPETLKDKPYADIWKANWASWWKAAKHAKNTNIGQPTHDLYKPISSAIQKAAANKKIRQLALQAETLGRMYDEAAQQATSTQKQLAQTKLTAALYGGDGSKATPGTDHTRKAFTTWDAACTGDENGKSIVGDFFCLCAPKDGTTKECADGYAPTRWDATIADPAAEWKKLQTSCPTAKLSSAKEHDIRMAIGAFLQALTTRTQGGTTKTYLGSSDTGACDGTSSKLCVDYTGYFSKQAGKTYKDIPWLKSLEDAVTALENMHKQEEKANNLDAQLANLLKQANLIYAAALNGDLMTETAVKAEVVPEGNPRQNVNCAQHDNNKTCVSPCKWESKGDKGTCKLDESKVTTQTNTERTGTGDGAAKHGVNCSSHATKEACEGFQGTSVPGKKAVCGWIEGKCQDSSFLVNKKFALMVSAFVAMLF